MFTVYFRFYITFNIIIAQAYNVKIITFIDMFR